MSIIDEIKLRAKKNKRKIVLTESEDERVVKAAIKASKEGIADIILIGDKTELDNKYDNLTSINIINPKTSSYTQKFIKKLYELRKNKGMTESEAKKLIENDYMYFACMLVLDGIADGVVSGACHSTANTLRPALQIIKSDKKSDLVSAFFLMHVPNSKYGLNGTFLFADSGLVQNPTSNELASIAYSSSKSFELLTGKKAIVAFLSHSTKGSAKHELVEKIESASIIAKLKYPDMVSDGELQLDAAIDPEIAKRKAPDSKVAGKANTLIFPNLDAGNIGYKLVERLAGGEAYGPITQGLKYPVNDLSRGCSVDDIVGVIAITSVQCK